MKFRLKFPSPSMVVAFTALLVALGGTGYAAIVLPANSVGTSQIKASAVTSAKLQKGAIVAADLNAGTVKNLKGPAPAVAYGSVSQSNVVTAKDGWTGIVTNPSVGIYCLTGFTGTLDDVIAQVDASTPDYGAVAESEIGYSECPSGTQIEVQTTYGRGTLQDEAFDFVAY